MKNKTVKLTFDQLSFLGGITVQLDKVGKEDGDIELLIVSTMVQNAINDTLNNQIASKNVKNLDPVEFFRSLKGTSDKYEMQIPDFILNAIIKLTERYTDFIKFKTDKAPEEIEKLVKNHEEFITAIS